MHSEDMYRYTGIFQEETELFITTNILAAKNIVQQKKPTLLYLMSRDIIV